MKKILVIILALALSIAPAVLVSAAENQYYLVEGYVTPNGAGKITRIELVDDITAVEVVPGTEYAISAVNDDGTLAGNYAFGVSFETAPDLPTARLDEARFAVLAAYTEEIGEFRLVNRQGQALSSMKVSARREKISIDVEDTGEGFALRWDAGDALDFDVYAVSQLSGEKNVLAYRIEETELFVPYDWLEPDDSIVFVLKSNDGTGTLTAQSEGFNTPPGESRDILDDEAWEGERQEEAAEEDIEWYWYLILFFLFVALPAGLVVLTIVLLKKRKTRKSTK